MGLKQIVDGIWYAFFHEEGLKKVEAVYAIRDTKNPVPNEITVYMLLKKHPYMIPVLLEGAEKARKYFTGITGFSLDTGVWRGPPNHIHLEATIHLQLPASDREIEEHAKNIEINHDKFNNEWWLKISANYYRDVSFGTSIAPVPSR